MASLKYFNQSTNQWEVIKTDSINGVIPNNQTWTSTQGQTTFSISNGQIADANLLSVFVDGKIVTNYTFTNNTTFTFLTGLNSGQQVYAEWFEVSVPATAGHHTTHEVGGQDQIDVTKLLNYQEQISTPMGTLQTNLTNHENDNSNPHKVTPAQIGAVPYTGMTSDLDLNGHSLFNGAKEIIKADSNGILRFPNQQNELEFTINFNSLAANVETTIPYGSNGSTGVLNFDVNGIYHVVSTGVYLFNASIYLNLTNSTALLNIYKNNSFMFQIDKYSNLTANTLDYVLKGSVLLGLNTGDTIKFTAMNTANCDVNAGHTLCSVVKVS